MYKKMYYTLFNAVTDAIDRIESDKYQEALSLLERACRNAEEIYISQ